MSTIDFSKMSDTALLDSKNRIDRSAFPANYVAAVAEIAKRGLTEEIPATASEDPYSPRPWLRCWARGIDGSLISFIFVLVWRLIFGFNDGNMLVSLAMILVFLCAYECASIHLTGTTLGKRIFGLYVKNKTGENPTWRESFLRTLSCLVWGSGFGILAPVTNLISYFRLKSTGTTKWDKFAGTVVMAKSMSLGQVLANLFIFYVVFGSASYMVTKFLYSTENAICASECKAMFLTGQLKGGIDANQCIQKMCK